MKVRLEFDITPEEAPRVQSLISALKDFALTLSTTSTSPPISPSNYHAEPFDAPFPRASPNPDSYSSLSTSRSSPSRAANPAAIPAAIPPAAIPHPSPLKPPRSHTPASIFADVAIGKMDEDAAVAHITALLASPAAAPSHDRVIEAATLEIVDPDKVGNHPSRGVHIVRVLVKLGHEVLDAFKQQFVNHAVRQFIYPRPVDCNRAQFLGYSDGLAALVQEQCITADAALKTILKLLLAPGCCTAAISTLCRLAETCDTPLDSRCQNPLVIEQVKEQVEKLAAREAFLYDITYLNGATGWKIPLPS